MEGVMFYFQSKFDRPAFWQDLAGGIALAVLVLAMLHLPLFA